MPPFYPLFFIEVKTKLIEDRRKEDIPLLVSKEGRLDYSNPLRKNALICSPPKDSYTPNYHNKSTWENLHMQPIQNLQV